MAVARFFKKQEKVNYLVLDIVRLKCVSVLIEAELLI